MKLTAEILGEPAPDVGWAKDGEDIEEDDRRGREPRKGRAWSWEPGRDGAKKIGASRTGAGNWEAYRAG